VPKVVIIGAGGHARETLEILLHAREEGEDVDPIGFIDENPANHGRIIDGFPVLGDFQWFEDANLSEIRVICAVGKPKLAQQLVRKSKEMGLQFINAISPAAHISPKARIGKGVIIFPHVVISTGVIIEDFVTLNVAVTVSHDTIVGKYSNINPGAHLAGNVKIDEGCYVGMGANVIQGISIGRWSVIGAGAVVIEDIPAGSTAVGVPAKVIKNKSHG